MGEGAGVGAGTGLEGGAGGAVSTSGKIGTQSVEDLGGEERSGRGKLGGSLTLPSKGGGTPREPGRWRGGALRGPKCSLTVPGRGNLGGSPSSEVIKGGPRSGPSALTGRERGKCRSTGTNTPPTMTVGDTGESKGGVGGL